VLAATGVALRSEVKLVGFDDQPFVEQAGVSV